MRQCRITMKNGTSFLVRKDVKEVAQALDEFPENKFLKFDRVDQEGTMIIRIDEVSTIEDAGLWRARL